MVADHSGRAGGVDGLSIQIHSSLPALAWLLDWRDGRGVLHCGQGVETREDGWFEGVWAGDFAAWDFDRTADVFGSGGLCRDGRLRLVAPSHGLEPIFLKQDGRQLLASNSLAFLLSYAGSGIDPSCFEYAEIFLGVLEGIDHLCFEVPCLGGRVQVVHHFNIEVDSGGVPRIVEKAASPPLPSYEAYVEHVSGVVTDTFRNACSPERQFRFTPLSTLSKGYDSPACAVFARGAGCDQAVTFESSLNREGSRQHDDNGAEIGRQLGLEVRTYRRELPPGTDPADFAQFFCDGGTGGELFWLAMADALPGRALITGFTGGSLWSLYTTERALHEINDCSGRGLGEFRRATGFAHVPLTAIAGTRQTDVLGISRSPAMAPWAIGNDYDRPIPRRIVEDAGIARQSFGQMKTGNSYRAWYPEHWPDRFREEFRRYREAHPPSAAARLRYGLKLVHLQILRFSCERRFVKHLAGKLTPFGYGRHFIHSGLRALSWMLRQAMRPFNPPPYKMVIRMHPRYTYLLAWATDTAACRYDDVRPKPPACREE